MKNYMYLFIVILIVALIGGGFFVKSYYFPEKVLESFDLDTIFLKIATVEEETAIGNIKVTSNYDSQQFYVRIGGITDMVSFNEKEFALDFGETKNIELTFDTRDKDLGVYLGEIEVRSERDIQKIPVVFEIQSDNALFDGNLNLFPRGDTFEVGDKITFETKIFDLANIGRSQVKLNYLIKSFDDRIIISESENVVVDGNLDYSKSLNLPQDLNIGNYGLIIILEYNEVVGTSSAFFKIVDKRNELIDGLDNSLTLIVGIFAFFFLLFLWLFFYTLFHKDKLLIELHSQYKKELRRQGEIVDKKEKREYNKLKNDQERRQYKKVVSSVKKRRIKAIKQIFKERAREFKKIKKSKDKNKLKRQLNKWKSQGYDTSVLERRFKIPKAEDFRKQIKKWKRKGYDTKILERKLK